MIALPTSPKSDSYGALRYRPPTSQKRTDKSALALSHPHIPQTANCLQQRFAIALPHPKSDRTPTSPKANCLQQRFAIALPHPKKRAHSPHPQKEIALPHPKQRTDKSVLALSHPHIPQTAIAPHIPKQRSHPTSPKSELLAAAPRYRPSHPKSDTFGAFR